MKRLKIPRSMLADLRALAEREMPDEACGIMAGTGERVSQFYPMTNADHSPEHYTMVPREQFDVVKDMRKQALKMLAIWHSHPATPARMSDEDIRLAYATDVYYVILSLAVPEAEALRGFDMIAGKPNEIAVEIIED